MKTARSIEEQESRKAEEKGRSASQNSGPVSGRRGRVENLKPWPKGVSGNPGGKPKVDLAAQIARAIFENDGKAIYAAYAKMLRKGSPYAFQVLSDRAFGKLKESVAVELGPFRDVSDEDLQTRLAELEREVGLEELRMRVAELERGSVVPAALPPASDDSKPN